MKKILVRDIVVATAAHFELTPAVLLSSHRSARVARARQVAFFLAHKMTAHSIYRLSRLFRRDHTTILHGIKKIQRLLDAHDALVLDMAKISAVLAALDNSRAKAAIARVYDEMLRDPAGAVAKLEAAFGTHGANHAH